MEPWALDGEWGTFSPASTAVLSCQREEAAAGSGGAGYITSVRPLRSPFPPSPVSSAAASAGVGVTGWGLALAPAADHMCLECADVSLGAPAGPRAPPSIWTGEWAHGPLLSLAEEETETAQGCRAGSQLLLSSRRVGCSWSHPRLRNTPDLLVTTFSLSSTFLHPDPCPSPGCSPFSPLPAGALM